MSDEHAKWADFEYSRLTGHKIFPRYAGGYGLLGVKWGERPEGQPSHQAFYEEFVLVINQRIYCKGPDRTNTLTLVNKGFKQINKYQLAFLRDYYRSMFLFQGHK